MEGKEEREREWKGEGEDEDDEEDEEETEAKWAAVVEQVERKAGRKEERRGRRVASGCTESQCGQAPRLFPGRAGRGVL